MGCETFQDARRVVVVRLVTVVKILDSQVSLTLFRFDNERVRLCVEGRTVSLRSM